MENKKIDRQRELSERRFSAAFNRHLEHFLIMIMHEKNKPSIRYRNGVRMILEENFINWIENNYPNIHKEWELHLKNKLLDKK